MPKRGQNPIFYASKSMNELINSYGDFTTIRRGGDADGVRLFLSSNDDFRLLKRMVDYDGDMTSVFEHTPTRGGVMVREWMCTPDKECKIVHGEIIIRAASLERFSTLLDVMDNDEYALVEYLEFMHENRPKDHDDDID